MATTTEQEKREADYAVRESAMRKTVSRHRDGCPEKRLEVAQERGDIKVVRCVDCGEQVATTAL